MFATIRGEGQVITDDDLHCAISVTAQGGDTLREVTIKHVRFGMMVAVAITHLKQCQLG